MNDAIGTSESQQIQSLKANFNYNRFVMINEIFVIQQKKGAKL